MELGSSGAENVLVGPIQRLRGYAEKWRKGNHKFQLDWEVGHFDAGENGQTGEDSAVVRLEEEQHHTQENVVLVQLVDEQLVNLEVPPAEITVTTFPKLISDLAFYSGLLDVQGLLVKSKSGHYVQVFDIERIPKGDIKVRPVVSGHKHFLRVYASNQLEE